MLPQAIMVAAVRIRRNFPRRRRNKSELQGPMASFDIRFFLHCEYWKIWMYYIMIGGGSSFLSKGTIQQLETKSILENGDQESY